MRAVLVLSSDLPGASARSSGVSQPSTSANHAELQAAAAARFAVQMLDVADSTGALARAFLAWVSAADAELTLIRRWRAGTDPFATARQDAVALTVYLLWRCPNAHHVAEPLAPDVCRAQIARLREADGAKDGVKDVLAVLERHAPREHIDSLSGMLQEWAEAPLAADAWPLGP